MWARYASVVLGLWLMVAPGIFDYDKSIANNGHITGPLIITFSIIAIFECTRNVKYATLPLGAWLIFAPWILGYDNDTAFANDYITGLLVMALSLVRQKRENQFGGGWPALWKTQKNHG
jgi:hypothetical protein